MVSALSSEVADPLHTEQSAVKRLNLIELDDTMTAARFSAPTSEAGLSLGDHRPLTYKAEAPPLRSVHSSFLKKRKASSPMVATGHQSKKITRTSFDGKVMEAGAESVAEMKQVI